MKAIKWEEVPETVDELTAKTAAVTWDVKRAVWLTPTDGDVGFYWEPQREKLAMFVRGDLSRQSHGLCKHAAVQAVGVDHVQPELLTFTDVASGAWVKVAASPMLRRAGELLNFLPGKYPGGFANSPSPLASSLTSGLVGAGIGYGAGRLGEKMLGRDDGRLSRTLAVLGGTAGATPGVIWGVSNLRRGKSLTDGSAAYDHGTMTEIPDVFPEDYEQKVGNDEFSSWYTQASEDFVKEAFGTSFYSGGPSSPTAVGVNINKMGQTLWEVGASPRTAATTMGALYAAQQLPDKNSRPGFVTTHQTGLLGTMMGAAGGGVKGYLAGALAGKALDVLTGTSPSLQNRLKQSGATLGVINAVVPRFFQ